MKLNNDDFITILKLLNVNLKDEKVVTDLIEGYRFLGEYLGTDDVHAKINLYCLLGKFVNLNDPNTINLIKNILNRLEQNPNIEVYPSSNSFVSKKALNSTQRYIETCIQSGNIDFEILVHDMIQDFGIPLSNSSTFYFKEAILYGLTHNVKNISELYSAVSQKFKTDSANVEREIRYLNTKYIQQDYTREINKMFFAVRDSISDGACLTCIIKYIKNLEKIISQRKSPLSQEEQKNFENEQLVIKTLYELGFSSNFMGYDCLKEAILYLIKKKKLVSITKELYPTVAKKLQLNQTTVERTIRTLIHATKKAYPMIETDIRTLIFESGNKISNSKIIYEISDYILNYQKNFLPYMTHATKQVIETSYSIVSSNLQDTESNDKTYRKVKKLKPYSYF